MEQACGWLRWTPEVFWGATLAEVTAGVIGYMETRGVQRPNAKAKTFDGLLEMVRQAQRAERTGRPA